MALYWPSNIPISYESQDKATPRLLSAKFGDGYEQRTPTNLNPAPRTGSVRCDQPRATITQLEDFLKSTGGWLPFWFSPPPGTPPYLPYQAGTPPPPYFDRLPPFTPPGIFVADQGWTITEKGNDYALLEVTIREVFEIT